MEVMNVTAAPARTPSRMGIGLGGVSYPEAGAQARGERYEGQEDDALAVAQPGVVAAEDAAHGLDAEAPVTCQRRSAGSMVL